MLAEPSFNIHGDPGIVGVIRTEGDVHVDMPVHCHEQAAYQSTEKNTGCPYRRHRVFLRVGFEALLV